MADFDAEALARKHGLGIWTAEGCRDPEVIAALNEAFAAGRDSGMREAIEIAKAYSYEAKVVVVLLQAAIERVIGRGK